MEDNNTYLNNERELVEMSEEVRKAFADVPAEGDVPSVDAAWQKFDAEHHVTARRLTWWKGWSVAAGFLLVFTLVVAFGVDHFFPAVPTSDGEAGAGGEVSSVAEPEIEVTSTEVIYRNALLSTIVEQLAEANNTRADYLCETDLRLYVTIDRSWTLQECVDFLNNFEQVHLTLTADNVIVVR